MTSAAFSPTTIRHLDRAVLEKQRTDRIPGLLGTVARRGELLWSRGVGSADLDAPGVEPDPDTQFAVASNTKTFVAVAIMALRDEGRLSLDDTVDAHVSGSTHGGVTIRQLLAHTSGMQREPVGDVWDSLEFPGRDALLAGWDVAERVHRPHTTHHYSNLGYAVLGEILARLDGGDWFASVRRRILDPLELRRTTLGPAPVGAGPQAGRYFVPPWSDVPFVEPVPDLHAFGPAGGLCSTAGDLARWGGFVANPVDEVLSADTIEEMCQPQITAAPDWSQAWGLGWMLVRRDGHTWVGHTGGFPGAISGCFTHRDDAATAVLLMNGSHATDAAAATVGLGARVVADEPVEPEPWRPGTSVPDELVPLLGQWFSEGRGFVFSVREGRLEARAESAPAGTPPSVFEPLATDVWRTVSGREHGELLRVRRDDDGRLVDLAWATYAFTREPRAFGPA